MRKIMTGWIVLALLSATLIGFASPSKAAAEEEGVLTGNVLYRWCTGESRGQQALCISWISGFFEGLSAAEMLAQTKHLTPVTCFPGELTIGQARLMIEKHMRDHPEELHNSAQAIAGFTLALAFPCKGSK